ncbi:protein SMAX1-LIKE 8-like [Silene latifolia]|uniref:protein SMAX1-LIKE 8-like n=1 Tax=Silene latifolia TaxID=37657 RepID=UPI003D76C7B6
MPTPVNAAKQCLNPEASHALDEAVSVARRRGHPQTTSLHAVSSFLSLSPSQLKQACIKARNAAFYNPKVQLKALEFCLSVSLDRLPISQPRVDEPHVSNSLMAAIKRSQANQRRNPECIMTVKSNQGMQMGHCQDQHFGTISSSSGVKVDLQHLIVSILDDPIVSRVFNDAGFSSFDVKLAVLRPFQGLYKYPDPYLSRVRFPFSGSWDEEGEYRRVVELLRRKKGRNPLLVGVCANEVLKGFVEVLEKRKGVVLPVDICGIDVVSIEEELGKFATAKLSYDGVERRFKEVSLMVEQCLGPGLMVNVGNVRCFLGKEEEGCKLDVVKCVLRKLTQLLESHGEKVWLIGSAANDQTYIEFMSRFPLIDKDWDLQPLPITYIKSSIGESCFKSTLMRSFVPFGGFFSTTPELKSPFISSPQCDIRRNMFDGKLLPDAPALSKRVGDSVSDLGADIILDHLKAGYSCTVKDMPSNSFDVFQNQKQNLPNFCGKKAEFGAFNLCASMDAHQQSISQLNKQACLGPLTNGNFIAKLSGGPSKSQHLCSDGSCSPSSLCVSDVDDGQTPPSSGVSVDLGLDLFSQVSKQENSCHLSNKGSNHLNFKTIFKDLLGRVGRQSEALRIVSQKVAESWLSNGSHQRSDLRRDIWLNFIGPDIVGKRRTALALAEILFGNEKYFSHVNLGSEDVVVHHKKVFGYHITNCFDAKSRGKTVVDHIAEELRKTPFSVVFLENAHFADPVAQHSLLQAIKNGKFLDSYGREVSLTNRVFVLTSRLVEDSSTSSFLEARMEKTRGGPLKIMVKGTGDHKTYQNSSILGPEKIIPNQFFLCKRKLNNTAETIWPHKGPSLSMPMDLNLPAQILEDDYIEDNDNASKCKNGLSWLDEISDEEINKTLVQVGFDPFDYDALAANILKWIHSSFCEVTNSKCFLEIEPRAFNQILAAACLSMADQEVKDWIERVLSIGFAEVVKMYQLTSQSIVMLATCDGEALQMVDQVAGVFLPFKVNVT